MEPLDERVQAGTWGEFVRWQDKHVEPLGEPIVSEFKDALQSMALKTQGFRMPTTPKEYESPFNPLCRRIDGWPLRSVLIEGYELQNTTIRDRMFLDQRNTSILKIRANDEGFDATRALAWREREALQLADLLRRNEARILELRGSQP
jgi:hypothetical protein